MGLIQISKEKQVKLQKTWDCGRESDTHQPYPTPHYHFTWPPSSSLLPPQTHIDKTQSLTSFSLPLVSHIIPNAMDPSNYGVFNNKPFFFFLFLLFLLPLHSYSASSSSSTSSQINSNSILVALLVVLANKGQCGVEDGNGDCNGLARCGWQGVMNEQNDAISIFFFLKTSLEMTPFLSFYLLFEKTAQLLELIRFIQFGSFQAVHDAKPRGYKDLETPGTHFDRKQDLE